MKVEYLIAPSVFLLLCASFAVDLSAQWTRAESAERRAKVWEEIARKQGAALDDLLKADAALKAATERLQRACDAR